MTKNFDYGHNVQKASILDLQQFRKISLFVKIFEKSRLQSKFQTNLNSLVIIFANVDFNQIIENLDFEKSRF